MVKRRAQILFVWDILSIYNNNLICRASSKGKLRHLRRALAVGKRRWHTIFVAKLIEVKLHKILDQIAHFLFVAFQLLGIDNALVF
jgi:hypothetical protein